MIKKNPTRKYSSEKTVNRRLKQKLKKASPATRSFIKNLLKNLNRSNQKFNRDIKAFKKKRG